MGIRDVHASFTYTEREHTHAWETIPQETQKETKGVGTIASVCHSIP